jgi:hypothetical protein
VTESAERQAPEIVLFRHIAIAMLAWALLPFNPYGYYILLRWVVALVGLYLAHKAWDRKRFGWVAAFIIMSLLYNPITRVPLDRTTWSIINVLTIAILVGYGRFTREDA